MGTRATSILAVTFASAVAGMVVSNAAMWASSYALHGNAPQQQEQSTDRIIAAFGGMLGAGFAGFALGRRDRRPARLEI